MHSTQLGGGGGSLIRLVVIRHSVYLITVDLEFDGRKGKILNYETQIKFATRPRAKKGCNMHVHVHVCHGITGTCTYSTTLQL